MNDCPYSGPGRRDFLCGIAAIALPIRFGSGLAGWGSEVRYPVPTSDGATIDKEHEVIVVRHESSVYAFGLSCPHQKTPLRWNAGAGRFQCPKHKSTFQPDGAFIEGRATRNMDRYAIRRDGDNLVVDLAKLYREDQNREEWIGAVVRL
ncbi:MAG TPA: Rieske (2Fe-2S) protein [Gemmatimonadales bacterium]|nr:Rieske (2Fe-2S) protein [Gemmatimonadales bacterium]